MHEREESLRERAPHCLAGRALSEEVPSGGEPGDGNGGRTREETGWVS